MTDENPDTDTDVADASGAEDGSPAADRRPRPSPAAAAASRARRIGGRVGAAAAPQPEPEPPAPRRSLPKAVTFRKTPASVTEAPPPAPGGGFPAPPPGPRPPVAVPAWLRWAPAGVLTAGALVMAVLLVVFSHGVWWGRASGAAVREEMLAAAKTCVAKTNTYKYTALDAYSRAADECTTGQLTPQLQKTITTIIKKYAPTLKATQTAQISRGAIEAVSPHGKQWTVLVFGQLTVVNTNDPKGRTDPFAAQVQMEKVNGKWRMSGLKTVASLVP